MSGIITLDKFKKMLSLVGEEGYSVKEMEVMLPEIAAAPDGTFPNSPKKESDPLHKLMDTNTNINKEE